MNRAPFGGLKGGEEQGLCVYDLRETGVVGATLPSCLSVPGTVRLAHTSQWELVAGKREEGLSPIPFPLPSTPKPPPHPTPLPQTKQANENTFSPEVNCLLSIFQTQVPFQRQSNAHCCKSVFNLPFLPKYARYIIYTKISMSAWIIHQCRLSSRPKVVNRCGRMNVGTKQCRPKYSPGNEQ